MTGTSELLMLIAAAQGILISLALLSALIKDRPSNGFLGLITLVISLEIMTIWAVRTGYTGEPGRFPFWILSSYLILPPALYLLGKINTVVNFRVKRWHWYLFLPALLEILMEFYGDYTSRHLGTGPALTRGTFWFVFTEIVPILGVVFVLILFGADIHRLSHHLKQLGIRHAHLQKVRAFHLLFSLLTLLWILEAVFQLQVFRITITFLCGFVFLIGYISFYNPNYLLPPVLLRKKISEKEPGMDGNKKQLQRIRQAFENEQLYLRPKLSLKEAGAHMGMPPRQLSQLINLYFEMDFSNFVNSYRIKEMIRKVKEGELRHKTLLGLALESGFNSKSSFNQAFKDHTGKSPSEYFSDH